MSAKFQMSARWSIVSLALWAGSQRGVAQLPAPSAVTPAQHGDQAGAPVDLNTATLDELRVLPGMGPAYARRVIEGRPYTAKNQLITRGILPVDAYERVKGSVVAHRPSRTR